MRNRGVRSWILGVAIAGLAGFVACGDLGPTVTATHIGFQTQPNATAPSMGTLLVEAAFLADNGLVARGQPGRIDVALVTTDTAAHLIGSTSVVAVFGISTYNLRVDKAGTGYRLRISAPGFADAESDPFTIVPASPTHLRYSAPPQAVNAGDILPTVTVIVTDAGGNQSPTATPMVTISISNGTISGTLTKAAVAGSVSFSDLSIPTAGTYALTAAAGGFVAAQSNPFVVSPKP